MLTKSQLKKINQNQQVDLLKLREERYQYYGLLSEYQLHPPSIVNSLEYKQLLSCIGIRSVGLAEYGRGVRKLLTLGSKPFVIRK
jgi:hypothetical protein